MFGYIKRQYRNESKLPLDLRTPLIRVPLMSFDNFICAEKMFVQEALISKILHRIKYVKSELLEGLIQYNKKKFKKLKLGSFIAVIMISKTGLMSYPQASKIILNKVMFNSGGDSSVITAKYRGFVGHCIKKKNCKWSSYVILRTILLGCIFTIKINIFSPNLVGFFIIPKLWKKKNKKKLRIFKLYPKNYSSSISFKLKKIKKIKGLRLLKPKS